MRYVALAGFVALAVGLSAASARPLARQPVLVFASADPFEPGSRLTPDNVADIFVLRGGTVVRRLTRTTLWEEYPAWSPDGRRIAFSRGDPLCHASTCERRAYDASIWVRSLNRPAARRITRPGDSYIDSSPAWSADGRTIAFTRRFCCEDDPPKDGIYTIAPDGRRLERVARSRATVLDWSPDGSAIVFLTEEGRLRMLDVATGDVRGLLITNISVVGKTDVAWSPRGDKLALATGSGIYVVGADGGRARRVAKARFGSYGEIDPSVSWSADGRRLAFSAALERDRAARTDIYVVALNGRGLKRLTTNPGPDFDPHWRR